MGYLKTKPHGIKIRRHHPYAIHILDFYCHAFRLVIEVDGPIHNNVETKKHDKERQSLLEADGLTVMRFTNDEILSKSEIVIETISNFILNKVKV